MELVESLKFNPILTIFWPKFFGFSSSWNVAKSTLALFFLNLGKNWENWEKVGGVSFSGQTKLAEKVRKWRRQICTTNIRKWWKCKKFCGKIVYLLKNMIFVCVYPTFKQWLNRIGRTLAVPCLNAVQTWYVPPSQPKIWRNFQKIGGVWTLETLTFRMYALMI